MERGREEQEVGMDGGRRGDLRGLKHISIHGEEEASDSTETEEPDGEQDNTTHTHTLFCMY